MKTYWSNTKIADFIRGTKKLNSGTSLEWTEWENTAKHLHRIRYWIAEEAFDGIQNFIYWPFRKIGNVKSYISNRFISKSNSLIAHHNHIKKGTWCEIGDRFLPCLFDSLVDFVEVDSARMELICNDEGKKKYFTHWWSAISFNIFTYRNAEAGISHLQWAANLAADESYGLKIEDKGFGEPTAQAKAAKEILELYNWWTEIYPNRPDPYDASGWSEYCDNKRKANAGYLLADFESNTPEDKQTAKHCLTKLRKIETSYQKEDTNMLIRLIKIRESLWT